MFGRIKKIFKNLIEESDIIEKTSSITTEDVTFEELISNIEKKIQGEEIPQDWLILYDYYKSQANWNGKLENALKGIDYTTVPEKISDQNIDKLYGNKVQTSISKLEQYSSCAFSYYLKYTLKIKEDADGKIQSMDTGSFMHDLIDNFMEYIKEEKIELKQIDEEEIDKIVKDLVQEKLKLEKNYIFTMNKKYQFLVIRLMKLLKTALLHIVESLRYSDFEILGNEIEFKEGKDYDPIQIDLDNGKKLELEGKIDRADFAKSADGKYLRIIDYKSSVKNLDLNEIEYGLQLQLFTYLDVLCKEEDSLPAGVLYFSLIDPIIKADKKMSTEDITEEIRKRFKMHGFVLSDINIVKMMDRTLEKGTSNKIPVSLDKDGNISSSKSNCLNKEQFKVLQKHIEETVKKIGTEILEGRIEANPYYQLKNKKTPCAYCPYHSICQIEYNIGKINYNFIPNQKKDAILERLSKKGKEEA